MKRFQHFALLSCVALMGSAVLADSYAENTVVSGDEIVLAVGETRDFDVSAGVTVTVSRVISGEGAIRKTGLGVLKLDGANSFTGGVDLVAGELWANAACALGSGPVSFTSSAQASLLAFNAPDATFANDIRFKVVPTRFSSYRGALEFKSNTRLTGNVYGPGNLYDWIVVGVQYSTISHSQNAAVVFDGDICFEGATCGALKVNGYGTTTFNGKVYTRQLSFSTAWSASGTVIFNNPDSFLGSTYVVNSYCPCLIYGADNIFTNMDLAAQYTYRNETANCMDLNGHDQTFRALRVNPATNPDYPLPQAPNDGYGLQVKSTLPATLTLTGFGAGASTDTYHAFNGALSLVLDADPTYTLNLVNRTHHMSGALIVSNGTLRATGAASFPSARRVVVAAGTTLDVATTTANAFGSCVAVDVDGAFSLASAAAQSMGHAAVNLGQEASLSLPADMVLLAKSLVVAGETKAEGYYTSADIPQLKSGRIRVTEQFWPELTEPVYTISVSAGETNCIDDLMVEVTAGGTTTSSLFSELAAPTAGTVLKVGQGVVKSSSRMAQFTGQLLVEEGGFAVNDNLQVGPQNRATAPVVWVKKGASFILYGTKDTCGASKLMLKNSFHFAGEGLNGLGALDLEIDAYQNYTFTECGTWFLDGDTRIGGHSTQRVDLYNTTLDMKGNRLEFKRPEGNPSYFTFFFDALQIKNAGDILVNGANFTPQGVVTWAQDVVSTISFTNGAAFGFWNSSMRETHTTTLKFSEGKTTWGVGGSLNDGSRVTPGAIKQAFWDGPVQVEGQLNIDASVDQKGAALRGRLSGDGALLMRGGWLHLTNADNDFAGTIGVATSASADKQIFERGLAVYANGALPLSCRQVAVTNSPVMLLEAARFDLPALAFQVPAATNQTFSSDGAAASGTLAGLLKLGDGTLSYAVPLAVTGVLEVAEGTLDVKGGSLAAGTLAMAGGTVKGDVSVTQGMAFAPAAYANGALKVLLVEGAVAFAEGAVLDLDELMAGAYPFSPRYGDHLVLQTTDGITGTPVLDRDSAAYQAGWRCGVKNGAL
ncbi:MAG: hypothetical protein MJ240_00405, partial [Kiritimatiellae bacterium]|nr:hypothetical protein [Kiritimatiellia bacterium]